MHTRTFLLTSAGLLATMVVTAAGAAAQEERTSTPAVLVTDNGVLTRQYEAPSLLVDRSDPDVVYLSAVHLQDGECRFFRSQDGGLTWARDLPAPQLEPYTNCGLVGGPQNIRTELKQAPDGTLYYLHHAHDPGAGGTRSILLGRSGDGGGTWESTVVHAGPKATNEDEVEKNFEPHMAFDPDNPQRIIVMWRQTLPIRGPGRTRPWMAISEDGGQTFGDAFRMFDLDMGFDGPRPIVVGDTLYAFHRVRDDSEEGEDPAVAPGVYVSVSTDEGQTWEPTPLRAEQPDDASEPVPVYDREAGRFHVVWHDNSSGNLDVYHTMSTDGTAWSEPARINDDPEDSTRGQYYPQITLAPDGRIDVAWYDYRDDPFPAPQPDEPGEPLGLGSNMGTFQSVYATSSEDGGRTWSDNLRVNDVLIDRSVGLWNRDFFFVVPVSLAATADSTVVAWSDTRHGNAQTSSQDIATSVVATPAAAAGSGNDALVAGLAGVLVGAGLAMVGAVVLLRRRGGPGAGRTTRPREPVGGKA